MSVPLHKYLAEFIGTGVLCCVVSTSIITGAFPTPLAAALAVGLGVYVVGAISGAHFNPAVTVSLWTIKKISTQDAIFYIIAQFIAAALVMVKMSMVFGSTALPLHPTAALWGSLELAVLAAEACGAFLLVYGISSVVHGRVQDVASGLVIGGSLLLGIYATSTLSLGALNPAVALSIGAFSWPYIVGPVLGGTFAAWVYRWMHLAK